MTRLLPHSALVPASMILVALGCAPPLPPSPPPGSQDYAPRATLATRPAVFRRGQSAIVTATLRAPAICREGWLEIRAYEVTPSSGEPTFATPYIAQAAAILDPTPAVGTTIDVVMSPLLIPTSAPERIYLLLWNACSVRIPKGIDQNGKIIWDEKALATPLGGATYTFGCPGGPTVVCGYRKD